MLLRVQQVRIPIRADAESPASLVARAGRALGVHPDRIRAVRVARRALDSRWAAQGRRPSLVLALDVDLEDGGDEAKLGATLVGKKGIAASPPAPAPFAIPRFRRGDSSPIVVGTGPAGLFAALVLVREGLAPRIVERGRPMEERAKDVTRFWRDGTLDPESNVQFGEGGAGTFSDGKLVTRVRDPRMGTVLRWFADFGAPPEILVDSKPHVGTERLRVVIRNVRRQLLDAHAEIRFGARVDRFEVSDGRLSSIAVGGKEIVTEGAPVVLATGHSSRDTYRALARAGVALEAKAFAIGVRVEHPQECVDEVLYGPFRRSLPLPPAEYALACRVGTVPRAVYSFCMCPGGRVISAASEPGCLVTNGMSYHRRSGRFANSAIVVSVEPADFGAGDKAPLAGLVFQKRWEEQAYSLGGGGFRAPAQRVGDFLAGRPSEALPESSYRPGLTPADLSLCLPPFVVEALREGIRRLDERTRGLVGPRAVLVGVETRTSSPVRIARDENLEALGARGLFPAGEGGGWSGGIVSSAIDGMKVAEKVIQALKGR